MFQTAEIGQCEPIIFQRIHVNQLCGVLYFSCKVTTIKPSVFQNNISNNILDSEHRQKLLF